MIFSLYFLFHKTWGEKHPSLLELQSRSNELVFFSFFFFRPAALLIHACGSLDRPLCWRQLLYLSSDSSSCSVKIVACHCSFTFEAEQIKDDCPRRPVKNPGPVDSHPQLLQHPPRKKRKQPQFRCSRQLSPVWEWTKPKPLPRNLSWSWRGMQRCILSICKGEKTQRGCKLRLQSFSKSRY